MKGQQRKRGKEEESVRDGVRVREKKNSNRDGDRTKIPAPGEQHVVKRMFVE